MGGSFPSAMAEHRGDRRRSLADLDGFRAGMAVLREMRGEPELAGVAGAAADLELALHALGDAVHRYDRDGKLASLDLARSALGRAVARLLIEHGVPAPDPVHGWLRRLECEVAPAIGGFARWVASLPGGRR